VAFNLTAPITMYQVEPGGALRWPEALALPPGIEKGERRFVYEAMGPWGAIRRLSGLATSTGAHGSLIVYGDRQLLAPRESGYAMEGRVAVLGQKFRAFTSSAMFIVGKENKLVNMAVLHVGVPTDMACDSGYVTGQHCYAVPTRVIEVVPRSLRPYLDERPDVENLVSRLRVCEQCASTVTEAERAALRPGSIVEVRCDDASVRDYSRGY